MGKIVNWAHRGASGYAPENTLAAFRKALEMKADGIECDLRESRDGALVVFHDPTLKRLASRREAVDTLSASELKKVDVGIRFSSAFTGETIPTLEEAVEVIPSPFLLNLEVKTAAPGKVVDFLERHGISDRVIVSSFNHALLGEIRRLDRFLRIGVLVDREPWEEVFRQAGRLKAVSLNISAKRATPERLRKIHQEGLEVHLYTVNEVDQMAAFIEMGADGLFTNYPDRLAELQ